MTVRRFACVLAVLISGCGATPKEAPTHAPGTPAVVTYSGEIPCADCPKQRVALTLFPDFTFRMRQTYVGVDGGRDRDVYDLGTWARAQDDGKRLALRGGTEAQRQYLFASPDAVRMLDSEGREIRSSLNYDLVRQPRVDRIEGPMRVRGMYMQQADAPVFNECLTRKRYPVLMEKDHAALERAYLAARSAPGDTLAAILTVRFVSRPPEPGTTVREHVLVEKFERLLPGETCAPQAAGRAELLETYWRPVEIFGIPVVIHKGVRELHIVLTREQNRVRGYTGCNTMSGAFRHEGDSLRFEKVAMTRRACIPPDANALESAFAKALDGAVSYRIVGESLELRDAAGATLMRLEARYLR